MTLEIYFGGPKCVRTLEMPIKRGYSRYESTLVEGGIYEVLSEHLKNLNNILQGLHEKLVSRLKRMDELEIKAI